MSAAPRSGRSASAGTTYRADRGAGHGLSAAVVVTGVVGVAALVAFLVAERRSANPMMPLDIFSSRQFSAANLVTFVVYAAIGGFFFLLVSFLQISLGYSPDRRRRGDAAGDAADARALRALGRPRPARSGRGSRSRSAR